MSNLVLSAPLLGFVVGTRAALAFGVGLLVAGRIPEPRRRAIAITFIAVGAVTTVPAARSIFRSRSASPRSGVQAEAHLENGVRTVADM
jgi:hypothetical protein